MSLLLVMVLGGVFDGLGFVFEGVHCGGWVGKDVVACGEGAMQLTRRLCE